MWKQSEFTFYTDFTQRPEYAFCKADTETSFTASACVTTDLFLDFLKEI